MYMCMCAEYVESEFDSMDDDFNRNAAYVRAFAGVDGQVALLDLLSANQLTLLYELADELHHAVQRLAERAPPRANVATARHERLSNPAGAQPGCRRAK